MKIVDRIDKAIAEHGNKFGEIEYTVLARYVFPRDEYPRAWRYSSNGGPPGCYMALTRAIRKHGFGDHTDPRSGQRFIGRRRNAQ